MSECSAAFFMQQKPMIICSLSCDMAPLIKLRERNKGLLDLGDNKVM